MCNAFLFADIAWAGIGAALVGVGSLLTGYAALKTARTNAKKEAMLEEKEHVETITHSPNGG